MKTSRGWEFDLISSIANELALTSHLLEYLYSLEKDMKDMMANNVPKDEEIYNKKAFAWSNAQQLLKKVVDHRRNKMSLLMVKFEGFFEEKMWCSFKHAIEMWMQDTEVYLALYDEQSYKSMNESYDIMAGIISLTLGIEFTVCARCLFDKLAGKGVGQDGNDKQTPGIQESGS